MARTFAGVPASEIDLSAFHAMRAELPGWVLAPQVLHDDSTSFFAIREEIGTLTRSAFYPEKGKLSARHLRFYNTSVLNVIEGENLIAVESVNWGDKRHLITSLLIKYWWGWSAKADTMTWKRSLLLDADESEVFAANKLLLRGLSSADIDRRRVIEARMMGSNGTIADRVANKLEEWSGLLG